MYIVGKYFHNHPDNIAGEMKKLWKFDNRKNATIFFNELANKWIISEFTNYKIMRSLDGDFLCSSDNHSYIYMYNNGRSSFNKLSKNIVKFKNDMMLNYLTSSKVYVADNYYLEGLDELLPQMNNCDVDHDINYYSPKINDCDNSFVDYYGEKW